MHNSRTFANIAQKLVAEAFAPAGPAYKTGNVDKINAGVDGLFGLGLGGQSVHPFVRHSHGGLVGLDGAKGIVGGLSILGLGQGVEQGGFAYIGQAHNTNTERHVVSLRYAKRRIARSGRRARAGLAANYFSGLGSGISYGLPLRARQNLGNQRCHKGNPRRQCRQARACYRRKARMRQEDYCKRVLTEGARPSPARGSRTSGRRSSVMGTVAVPMASTSLLDVWISRMLKRTCSPVATYVPASTA